MARESIAPAKKQASLPKLSGESIGEMRQRRNCLAKSGHFVVSQVVYGHGARTNSAQAKTDKMPFIILCL